MLKDTASTPPQLDVVSAKARLAEAKMVSEKSHGKAIELLNGVAEAFEVHEEWELFMEASNEAALAYIRLFDYFSAIQNTEYALKMHQEKCPQLFGWEVHLCTTKHKALYKQRKFNDSLQILIRAQQIIENEKMDEWLLIENLVYQSNCHIRTRKYPNSRELLKSATKLIEKQSNPNDWVLMEFYDGAANLEFHTGNFPLSKQLYEKGYELSCLKDDYFSKKVSFHYNMGKVHGVLGNREKEFGIYFETLKMFETLNNKKLENQLKIILGFTYSQIGKNLCELGDPIQAFHYFEKAQILYEQIGTGAEYHLLGNLSDLSHLYADQKNYVKQLEYCEKALEISQKAFGDKYINVSIVYTNIADAYRNLGDMDKALIHYEKALEIDIELKGENHHSTFFGYLQLGYYWTINKGYSKGLEYLYKTLEYFQNKYGDNHQYIYSSYYMIGFNFEQQGKLKTALEYYQLALTALLSDYQETNFYHLPTVQQSVFIPPPNFLEVLLGKAITFCDYALDLEKKDVPKAVKALKASLDACQLAADYLQELHKTLKAEDSKLIFVEKILPIYQQAIKTILLLANRLEGNSILEQAFAFHELAKALLLRSSMQESEAKTRVSIDSNLLQREKDLKNQIEKYVQKIQKEEAKGLQKDKATLQEWKQNHFDELLKHQALIEQLERDYPEYYQLKYDLQTVSIAVLQKDLDEDTVIISYFIRPEMGYIFVVTSDEYEVIPFEIPKDFDQQIEDYLNSIHAQNISDFIPQSHALYFLLIEPISYLVFDPFAGKPKNVVILPSASLNYLPFETLIREIPHTSQPAFQELDYLLQHCQIQYHYSATLYHQSLKKNAQEKSLSPSIKKPNSLDFLGFAPIYTSDKEATQDALRGLAEDYGRWATRSDALRDGTLAPLPFSEKEVENIEALFTNKGLSGQSFLYNTATKEHFKTLASNAKYLHIAAHGLTNDEYPKLSGIVFHPTEEATEIHDSILSMGEMYQLQLQADLVVLSSCESGIGKLAKGEGMMAMNRGFLYAGAKNVIYTLFKVLDKPSSELCEALFEEILEGKTYTEALRLAKLRLIQRADVDPKSWSGFVLLGA